MAISCSRLITNPYLCRKILCMAKNMNRLKVVLAEQNRTNKWLAEQLHKDPGTISKWCTNTLQPNLETIFQIAECLGVDSKDLLWSIKSDKD